MEEIDINYIKQKLSNIVHAQHTDPIKMNVKEYPDRIAISCPICGDSQKRPSNYRGSLYLENLFYVCYNCGSKMSFTKLCDTFNEPIEMEHRIKIYNYVDANIKFKNNNSDYILEEMDKLIDLEDFLKFFNNKKDSWLYDVKPVQKNSHVYQYLKYERMIEDFSQIYQGIYRVVKSGKTVFETRVMINMNMLLSDKKLLGIQLRNLEKGDKRFFKIVDFEQLYNYMNPASHLDELEAISYNKLSHFFNILNINFEEKITIFEGFLDSIFYPNSIGLIGTNSTDDIMKFLTESDENIDIQFFLDKDMSGIGKSTKMLKKGFPVFLWNRLFNALIDKSKDKRDAKNKLKGITDLNELVKISRNPNVYESLKLNKFFSIDEYDLIYLDKISYDKDKKIWYIK